MVAFLRTMNMCLWAFALFLTVASADVSDNEVHLTSSTTPQPQDLLRPLTVIERELLSGVFSPDELDYISTDSQSLLIVRSWLKEQNQISVEVEATTKAGQSEEDVGAAAAAQAQSRMDTFQAMRDYELNAEAVAAREFEEGPQDQAQDRMDTTYDEVAEPIAEDRVDILGLFETVDADADAEAEDRVDVLGLAEQKAQDRKGYSGGKHGGFGFDEPEAEAENRKDHSGGKHGGFGFAKPEAEAEDRKDHSGGKHGGFGFAEPEAEAEDRKDHSGGKHGGFGFAEPEAEAENRKDHSGGKHGGFGFAEPEAEAENRKDHSGGKHGGFGFADPEAEAEDRNDSFAESEAESEAEAEAEDRLDAAEPEAEDRMDTIIDDFNDRPERFKGFNDDTITVYESVTILSMAVAALSLTFLSLVIFVFRRKIRIMLRSLFRPKHYAQF